MRHARGNVDDVRAFFDEKLVTQGVENLLPFQEHMGFLALVRVHRGSAAGCGVRDADRQVLVPVPLSLHDVDVLAGARVDDVQIALGESEVLDVLHRGLLERPGHSARFQDLVGMVLGIQLLVGFIGGEHQLAVVDLLARLRGRGQMVDDRLRRQDRFRLHFRGGRRGRAGTRRKDQHETESDDKSS